MIVMPSNNSSMHLGWLAGRYPRCIGWLLSPGGWRTPHEWMEYACDNDKYAATVKGLPWDEAAYLVMLEKVAAMVRRLRPPRWLLVPDVPFSREGTLREWDKWAPRLQPLGLPLAFAVQDGMTQADVPREAAVVFLGGSTEWKWNTLWRWCEDNARVHVARVNGYDPLWDCIDAGAESTDGTGWFRGDQEQLAGLERFLYESTNAGRSQARTCA